MTTPAKSHGRPWHLWRETQSSIFCSAWWEIQNLSRYYFEQSVFFSLEHSSSHWVRYNYSAWQLGEVLVIKITNILALYISLKRSTKWPDLVTFPVSLLGVVKDVALPVFGLLTCSWPAVHQSSPFTLQPSLLISAGFKLPIMQRSLIYETSCIEPQLAHLFPFVSFSHINMD